MPRNELNGRLLALAAAISLCATPAAAQSPGTRAAGMAEAFVAVADDATSVFWNPAGQATGAYLSFVVDFADDRGIPDPERGEVGLGRFVGATVPPLGLAYYRRAVLVRAAGRAAESDASDREDGERTVQVLTTSVVGVTVAQSLGDYLVVAATTKILRGEMQAGIAGFGGSSHTRVDVDAGLMAAAGPWRAGAVVRNLTTPEFDRVDAVAGRLERDVRIGAAWGSGWPGGVSRLVLSADANLTRQPAQSGDRRDLAAGAETWWWAERLALRGGVRASTTGEARPVAAAGVSVAVRPGLLLEAHLAGGNRESRSWSAGVRVTF